MSQGTWFFTEIGIAYFDDNSGSNCRTRKIQLCTERGHNHKSKNVCNTAAAFLVYVLFNNKDGHYFRPFFLE